MSVRGVAIAGALVAVTAWVAVRAPAGADRTDPVPVPRLCVVHCALPGRPASDAMDRTTFTDRRVRATLARRFAFVRCEAGSAPPSVGALVRGLGTVVLDGDEAVAMREGPTGPDAFLAFLRDARRAAPALRAARAAGRQEDVARLCAAGGLREAAIAAARRSDDPALLARLLLDDGRVAAARAALSGIALDRPELVSLDARVLLAERRDGEALARLEGLARDSDADDAVLGALFEARQLCFARHRHDPPDAR